MDEIIEMEEMVRWMYETEYIEHSTSETLFSELIKLRMPELYDRVYQEVHRIFCEKYSSDELLDGFGEYVIFLPYEFMDDVPMEE